MLRSRSLALVLALGLACAPAAVAADKAVRYPEAKHGKGELKYVNGVPVAVLEGTPAEIGEQFGTLVVKPAAPLIDKIDDYMKAIGWDKVFPFLLKASGGMINQFPADHRKEVEVASKVSGVDRNMIVLANVIADLQKIGGCSTVIVEKERSKTGGPLFGRNLDWPPFESLPEHTLVAVFKPKGKHSFAIVTLPPVVGCISGMNDAGLSVAINEITACKDGSPKIDVEGVPMLLLYRRILEECATVADAEKLLKASKRTSWCCLTVCDKEGGCVFEITPKNVVARRGLEGVCCCTNHFRTDELCVDKKCRRYSILEKLQNGSNGKLGVNEVAGELHKVNLGNWTIQTMVFEPATRTLHLNYGGSPATGKPLKKIELGPLFDKK